MFKLFLASLPLLAALYTPLQAANMSVEESETPCVTTVKQIPTETQELASYEDDAQDQPASVPYQQEALLHTVTDTVSVCEEQKRFDALDETLKTAAARSMAGMDNVTAASEPMLEALEAIESSMIPWAAHVIETLKNHLGSSVEDASQLFTAAMARAQAQEDAGIAIKDGQDIFASLRKDGDLWTAETFNAYADNTPLLTDTEIESWQGVLNVLSGTKQQQMIDFVLAHTGLVKAVQQPFDNEDGLSEEEVDPWAYLTEKLVSTPNGTVLDLTTRMAPLLRHFRKSPDLIANIFNVAEFWSSYRGSKGLNIDPGSEDDLLHQFVQQGPTAWGDDPDVALCKALGYAEESETEEQADEPVEEQGTNDWFMGGYITGGWFCA